MLFRDPFLLTDLFLLYLFSFTLQFSHFKQSGIHRAQLGEAVRKAFNPFVLREHGCTIFKSSQRDEKQMFDTPRPLVCLCGLELQLQSSLASTDSAPTPRVTESCM